MAAWGFSADDTQEKEIAIWPENWDGFRLFEGIATQWRVGFGGAVGLDYNVIPSVGKYLAIADEDMAQAFQDVREMEAAILKDMSDERAKNQT